MTTRRDVLRGAAMNAAAPTALATPAIAAAGDTSPVRAALTTFRQVHAERAAVVEQSSAAARSGFVATLDRVPSARIGSSNARPQSIILINQWCGIDSKNALDNAPCRSETPSYGPWKCFDPGTASC